MEAQGEMIVGKPTERTATIAAVLNGAFLMCPSSGLAEVARHSGSINVLVWLEFCFLTYVLGEVSHEKER